MMFKRPRGAKNLRCQKIDICQLRLLTLFSGAANLLYKQLKLLNFILNSLGFSIDWHGKCLIICDKKIFAPTTIKWRLMRRVFSWH